MLIFKLTCACSLFGLSTSLVFRILRCVCSVCVRLCIEVIVLFEHNNNFGYSDINNQN